MWTNDAANVSQDFDWHLQTSSAAKKMSQKWRTKLDFYELQASMKMSDDTHTKVITDCRILKNSLWLNRPNTRLTTNRNPSLHFANRWFLI